MDGIRFEQISVVVQGPLHTSEEDPRGSKLTQRCLASVRQYLPGAKIILSTWQGMDAQGLDYDELVFSQDPGPTVTKFNKKDKPHTVNINRQIVCTMAGLKQVGTPYAIKLRSDNLLTSNEFVSLYQQFNHRDDKFSFFRQRVVASNLFAKEYSQGKAIPFFPSDFFHFGLTEDLLDLWDLPLWSDYEFNPNLSGKRQHANYPFHQLHVEQMLWTAYLRKHIQIQFRHKFDMSAGQKRLSDQIFANNLIILDRKVLGLVVPKRLDQNDGFPYTHYTFRRWLQLYKRYCQPQQRFSEELTYRAFHRLIRGLAYLGQGVKQTLKLRWAEHQVTRNRGE